MVKEHFNRIAAVWDETVAEKDEARLRWMVERLEIKPGAAVLDVGTGTGVFLPYLRNSIGREGRIVALDFAEEMLARATAKNFNGNIKYLCADVTDIPFPDETFDAVVCYSSFPHFQDKPKALEELGRVTRGGGRLFICHTSGRDVINETHRHISAVQNDFLPGGSEMRKMLSRAGFLSDIRIEDDGQSYLCYARKPEAVTPVLASVAQVPD